MRLLLDEHISAPRLGEALRAAGHDMLAAAEHPALAGVADEALLRTAAAEGRIMVTHNIRDFVPILIDWGAGGRSHAGCVLIKGIHHSQFGLLLDGLKALFQDRPEQEEWIDLTIWLTAESSGSV